MKIRVMTNEERAKNRLAIRELVFIGVLEYAMLDLEEELINAGLYRFNVKKVFRQCYDIVSALHSGIYGLVLSHSDAARRKYADLRDDGYRDLTNCVGLEDESGSRSLSIVCALSRLILEMGVKLRGSYDYTPVSKLSFVLREVSALPFKDYSIDVIVDRGVNTNYTV